MTDTLLRQYGYSVYGLPTFRRIAGGAVQDFEYGFDPLTGNLLRRRDNNHSSSWEEFSYDSLDRLISAGGQEVTYALNGNLVGRGTDETMTYGSDGGRIRMVVTNSADSLLTRYYIGERYERESES